MTDTVLTSGVEKGSGDITYTFLGEKAPAVDEGASQVTFEALASGTSEHGCVWKQGPCGSS